MKKYDAIIDSFIEKENDTSDYSQKNLFSKEQYGLLLNNVLKILKENKDADIQELRQKLYEMSNLENMIRDFILNSKKAPGAVIKFGTPFYQEKIVVGNKQEVILNDNQELVSSIKPMEEDTIFDLASCSKLFTSVAILQLAGRCELRIDDKISKYLPQFSNLGNHTIFDLLTYEPYVTEKRIDNACNSKEAEEILFSAKPKPFSEAYGKDRYNDIAPMILKYIVEKVSGMSFNDYVKKNIFDKAKMDSSFVKVPSNLLDNVANCNYDYRILNNGELIYRDFAKPGVSSDSKAVILGQPDGILSGHAGIFSSCDDVYNFCNGLIDGKVLHPALTKEMAKNRTGKVSSTNPYYGFLCNSKHPNEIFCDMHQGLSGSSFSQSGWTGTYIASDPANGINLTYLSNRVHNRLTSYPDTFKYKLINRGNVNVISDGKKEIIDSSIYGFERRKITKACLSLALQERMLEEIVGHDCDIEKENVKLRKIK